MHLLAGKKVYVIASNRRHLDGVKPPPLESRYQVTKVVRWLPAGPISAGGFRKDDLVQFVAYKGGLRTVAAKDIVDIR